MKISPVAKTFYLAIVCLLCSEIVAMGSRARRELAMMVHGKTASKGEYPFAVSLIDKCGYFDSLCPHYCSCTLISRNTCLGSAHCMHLGGRCATRQLDSICALPGKYELDDCPDGGSGCYGLCNIHVHNKFRYGEPSYDIATFILKQEVSFDGSLVAPIPILGEDEKLPEKNIRLLGWGRQNQDVGLPNAQFLMYVDVDVLDSDEDNAFRIATLGRGPCFGDSGGPAIVIREGKHVLIGLISSGSSKCGTMYGYVTDIREFASWITKHSDDLPMVYVSPSKAAAGNKGLNDL